MKLADQHVRLGRALRDRRQQSPSPASRRRRVTLESACEQRRPSSEILSLLRTLCDKIAQSRAAVAVPERVVLALDPSKPKRSELGWQVCVIEEAPCPAVRIVLRPCPGGPAVSRGHEVIGVDVKLDR
jgi:hypothetical protein